MDQLADRSFATQHAPSTVAANPTPIGQLHESILFRARLLDALDQAVIATDAAGTITYWNRRAEELYGWRAAEVVGQSVIGVTTPPDDEAARSIFNRIRIGATWSGEFPVRRRDGSEFTAFVLLTPVQRDGTVVGVVGISFDVSLLKPTDRGDSVPAALPEMIVRISSDGTCLDVAGAEAVLMESKPVGRRLSDLLPPDLTARFLEKIRQSLATERIVLFDFELQSEERKTLEARIAPCGAREVLAVIRDITAGRTMADVARRARAELETHVEARTRALVERMAERESAEARLRESHERLRILIEASPIAIVEVNADSTVVTWNPAAERLFEWTAAEVMGRPNPVVPPERLDEVRGMLGAVLRGRTLSRLEVVRWTKSERRIRVMISAAPLREEGEITRILLLYDRVPDRADAELDDVAQRLTALKSLTMAVSQSLDTSSIITALRREIAEHLGIPAGAIFTTAEHGGPIEADRWNVEDRTLGEVLAHRDEEESEIQRIEIAGRTWLIAPMRAAHRDVGMLIVALSRDVTDADLDFIRTVAHDTAVALANAKLFEEAQTAQARTRELSRRLVAVQEQERRTIGRELHDQLGQMLTGLHRILDSMRVTPQDASARIAEAEAIVDELIERVRALSLELRPPMLDEGGLIPALSWHVAQYTRQTGIAVDLRHRDVGVVHGEVAIAAFRIVQEALTNVARHANVTEVRVRIWSAAGRLMIEVADAGRGFATAPAPDALGISGIHERAALLGGTAVLTSMPGEGTTVMIELPMPATEQGR
jgi:PAS domain S-box-containing protein